MRLLFRLLGLLCLAAAFAALIIDGTTSIAASKVELHPLGDTLAKLAPAAFEHLHAFVVARAPTLWSALSGSVFLLPNWVVLGAIGLVLLAFTRKPPPTVGYGRR